MRKVKFKRFIPEKFMTDGYTVIQGTGIWEDDFLHDGFFHQWVVDRDSFKNQRIVAIVELPDGTIEEVVLSAIKFIN